MDRYGPLPNDAVNFAVSMYLTGRFWPTYSTPVWRVGIGFYFE